MKLKDHCVQEKSMRGKDMGIPSISHELGNLSKLVSNIWE